MSVSFPQAIGCYDQTLQFCDIKHHFKPTWIIVWFSKASQKIHRSLSIMFSSFHFSFGLIDDFLMKFTLLHSVVREGTVDLVAALVCDPDPK
jgi:hypothetical protein